MNETIQTLIVDDEALARRGLELRLATFADVVIQAQCCNGREAIAAIKKCRPDLIFLDIQMPGMNGFEVMRRLDHADMPAVVFVTAFDQYAIDAFEAHALDYLLKPIEDDRLAQAMERVRAYRQRAEASRHRDHLLSLVNRLSGKQHSLDEALAGASQADRVKVIPIRDGHATVRVKVEEIDWVEAAGDYMCIHSGRDVHILRGTMKKLEDGLDARRFARVHRSTLVNVDRVKSLRPHINGEYFLTLDCGAEVKLSRSYRDRLKTLLPAM